MEGFPETEEYLSELGKEGPQDFCRIFRKCSFHFFRNLSVRFVSTSKRLSVDVKPPHYRRRRKIVDSLIWIVWIFGKRMEFPDKRLYWWVADLSSFFLNGQLFLVHRNLFSAFPFFWSFRMSTIEDMMEAYFSKDSSFNKIHWSSSYEPIGWWYFSRIDCRSYSWIWLK